MRGQQRRLVKMLIIALKDISFIQHLGIPTNETYLTNVDAFVRFVHVVEEGSFARSRATNDDCQGHGSIKICVLDSVLEVLWIV